MTKTYKYDVFISHSAANGAFARHLATELRKLEFHVWSPSRLTRLASKRIVHVMEDSAVCVLLFGPDGKSPWVNRFVWSAISDRICRTEGKFRVIPILLPTVRAQDKCLASGWGGSWGDRQQTGTFIQFDNGLDDNALNHLVLRIRGINYGEESIWNNVVLREKIRRRAKNILNVNWMALANSASANGFLSSPSELQQSTMGCVPNKVLRGRFGLDADNLHSRNRNSSLSSRKGESPRYSIDQIQDSGTNKRSDIYAVGATLYHLLTDVKPEDSEKRSVAIATSKAAREKEKSTSVHTLKHYKSLIDCLHTQSQGLLNSIIYVVGSGYNKENIGALRESGAEQSNQLRPFILHRPGAFNKNPNIGHQLVFGVGSKSIRLITSMYRAEGPFTRIIFNRDDLERSCVSFYDEGLITNNNVNQPLCSGFVGRLNKDKTGDYLVGYIDTLENRSGRSWSGFLPDNPISDREEQVDAYTSDGDSGVASIRIGIYDLEIVPAKRETNAWVSSTDSYRDWFVREAKNVSFLEPDQCFSYLMMVPPRSERICFFVDGLADNELTRLKTLPGLNLDGCGAFWQTQSLYHSKTESMTYDENTKDASVTSISSDDDRLFDLLRVFGVHPAIVDRERRTSS